MARKPQGKPKGGGKPKRLPTFAAFWKSHGTKPLAALSPTYRRRLENRYNRIVATEGRVPTLQELRGHEPDEHLARTKRGLIAWHAKIRDELQMATGPGGSLEDWQENLMTDEEFGELIDENGIEYGQRYKAQWEELRRSYARRHGKWSKYQRRSLAWLTGIANTLGLPRVEDLFYH